MKIALVYFVALPCVFLQSILWKPLVEAFLSIMCMWTWYYVVYVWNHNWYWWMLSLLSGNFSGKSAILLILSDF